MCCPSACVQQDYLIQTIFQDNQSIEQQQNYVIHTLANFGFFSTNRSLLEPPKNFTFQSMGAGRGIFHDSNDKNPYPKQTLTFLTSSDMLPTTWRNSIVLLLRNINTEQGLCYGTRLHLISVHRNIIEGEVLTGYHHGTEEMIPKLGLMNTDSNLTFKPQRMQFPLCPSYSMVINKSQGRTFGKVDIYLRQHVFAHEQLYVAFPGVKLFKTFKGTHRWIKYTRNIVD